MGRNTAHLQTPHSYHVDGAGERSVHDHRQSGTLRGDLSPHARRQGITQQLGQHSHLRAWPFHPQMTAGKGGVVCVCVGGGRGIRGGVRAVVEDWQSNPRN